MKKQYYIFIVLLLLTFYGCEQKSATRVIDNESDKSSIRDTSSCDTLIGNIIRMDSFILLISNNLLPDTGKLMIASCSLNLEDLLHVLGTRFKGSSGYIFCLSSKETPKNNAFSVASPSEIGADEYAEYSTQKECLFDYERVKFRSKILQTEAFRYRYINFCDFEYEYPIKMTEYYVKHRGKMLVSVIDEAYLNEIESELNKMVIKYGREFLTPEFARMDEFKKKLLDQTTKRWIFFPENLDDCTWSLDKEKEIRSVLSPNQYTEMVKFIYRSKRELHFTYNNLKDLNH